MATKKLDVWVVESETVYREVPFTVVADWLQQGRLLGEDRVRLSGQEQWHVISAVSAFKPYLPGPAPAEASDRAEALEPVELGLHWRRRQEEEDEDVDMIPLIDISLVLLIFFMMTASVNPGLLSPIATPPAKHQLAAIADGMWWVGIDTKSRAGAVERGPDGQPLPWFSFGHDTKESLAPTTSRQELIAAIVNELGGQTGEARVRIRADQALPIETIKGVTLDLQDIEAQLNRGRDSSSRLSVVITGEVSEPAE
jgi:biopolymer transport protein ExbD